MKQKIIYFFIDGLGFGNRDKTNPFYLFPTPFLNSLTGDSLVRGVEKEHNRLLFKGIDACLGVEGIPQSATGQTTLFTGINAAQKIGFHFPAFPDEALKLIIDEHTLLKKAVDQGFKATFANAYTGKYFELAKQGKRYHSVTTLSVLAAGLPFKGVLDLKKGEAVYWDITNEFMLSQEDPEVEQEKIVRITAEEAGRNLANLTEKNDLTIFECFMPDLLGHKRNWEKSEIFVPVLDTFLGSLIENLDQDTTLVVTSDHGNMEDFSTGGHTKNPVLFLVWGKCKNNFLEVRSIQDIPDCIMSSLK